MVQLEKKKYEGKPYYKTCVVGKVNYASCETDCVNIIGKIDEDDWTEADTLFFAYIGTYSGGAFTKWDRDKSKPHYGDKYKEDSVINEWLGFWSQGELDDPMVLSCDSISHVEISYIGADGSYSEVKLPDLEKLFETEEQFAEAFKKACEEKVVLFNQKYKRENDRSILPWELIKAKDVLKQYGWEDDELKNIFYVYCENGFNEIALEDNTTLTDYVNKVCKLEKATSGTKCYSGFLKETLFVLEKAILDCKGITDESKNFAIDVLKKYDGNKMLEDYQKECIKDAAYNEFKRKRYGGPDGTHGYSGIYIDEYDSMEDFYANNELGIESQDDLGDYYEDNLLEYNGKIYFLYEAD